MVQRETQTAKYWQNLSVQANDIEHLFKSLLEDNQPRSIEKLAVAVIERRCQEEELAFRAGLQGGTLYQPQNAVQVGDELIFSRYDYVLGTVVDQRPGFNPHYGDFQVIKVDFGEENGGIREFAADFLYSHPLNVGEGHGISEEGVASSSELYAAFGADVTPVLEEALEANEDFVRFQDRWLLKGMMVPIHEGHLNIAEAAIDINNQPLSADELLKDLDLPDTSAPALQAFSLNAILQPDPRFKNVGPKGEVRWYLNRLTPPDLDRIPHWLRLPDLPYDPANFDDDMWQLLNEIDDDGTDPDLLEKPDVDNGPITIVLNHPHFRAGTLPITPKTNTFFPEADEQYVRINLVDALSGEAMPGWVVSRYGFVRGLESWYAQNQLLPGAFITLEHTADPMSVKISYRAMRTTRKWIRGAAPQAGRIGFKNLRQAIGCEFDDFMVIGEEDPAGLDALWMDADKHRHAPISPLLRQVAMDLVKLSPQGNVHTKTLYSAINVVRRCPPAPILEQLATQACFSPMGSGYWTYDATKEG